MFVPCSLPQKGTYTDDISEFCPQRVPAGAQIEKEGEVRAFTGLTPSPGCHHGPRPCPCTKGPCKAASPLAVGLRPQLVTVYGPSSCSVLGGFWLLYWFA